MTTTTTAPRPYMTLGTAALASMVESGADRATLIAIAHELAFRSMPGARRLSAVVTMKLDGAPVAPAAPLAIPAAWTAPIAAAPAPAPVKPAKVTARHAVTRSVLRNVARNAGAAKNRSAAF